MVKNTIHATLLDDRVVLTTSECNRLFRGRESATDILSERHLAASILATVEIQVAQLCQTTELKDRLATQIMAASASLSTQMDLLVTIPGIIELNAAAFLADVGVVTRFRSQRQMSADLGARAATTQAARAARGASAASRASSPVRCSPSRSTKPSRERHRGNGSMTSSRNAAESDERRSR